MFVLHSRRGLIHTHPLSAELSRSSHTSFYFGHEKNVVFTFEQKQGSLSNSEEKVFSQFCSSLSHLNNLMPFFLVF